MQKPDLAAYFAVFGQVIDSMVAIDYATQQPRGFGFVTMATKESFDLVMASKTHEIFGKWMDLKPAVDRDVMKQSRDAPPAGGFGGGGEYRGGSAQVGRALGAVGGTRNLHVANLDVSVDQAALRAMFSPHCTVREVVMKQGFAFVNTTSVEEATAAMTALQGQTVLGRVMSINYAKDRDRPDVNAAAGIASRPQPVPGPYGAPPSHRGYGGGYQQAPQHVAQQSYGAASAYGTPSYGAPPPGFAVAAPVSSGILSGAWMAMAQVFAENAVVDGDSRTWE